MAVKRLNHAVLYVRDVDRSVRSTRKRSGFTVGREVSGRRVL